MDCFSSLCLETQLFVHLMLCWLCWSMPCTILAIQKDFSTLIDAGLPTHTVSTGLIYLSESCWCLKLTFDWLYISNWQVDSIVCYGQVDLLWTIFITHCHEDESITQSGNSYIQADMLRTTTVCLYGSAYWGTVECRVYSHTHNVKQSWYLAAYC